MSAQRSSRDEQATEISAAISSIHRTAFERHLSSVDTMVSEVCVASVLRFDVARSREGFRWIWSMSDISLRRF